MASYHVQIGIIWLPPSVFEFLVFLSLALLLWLGISVMYWLKVEGLRTFISFLILEEPLSFSPFSIMFAIGLSHRAFIVLSYIPSSYMLSFFRAFIMKACWIFQRLFMHQLKLSWVFCHWLHLCTVLYF
jgi:hypothetical protein